MRHTDAHNKVSHQMGPEHKILFDRRPDPSEVKVRAFCGGLLGAVIALGLWIQLGPFGIVGTALVFTVSIVSCGIGAVRWGDPFWHKVVPWLRVF